jgi:predicted HTH domain antitoxin
LEEKPYLCCDIRIQNFKIKIMERQIAISYPESLAFSLKMATHEFEEEIKTISIVKLYELGKISSGIAANILKMSRLEFLKILSCYNVSYFSTTNEELETDFINA